ncbi:hypothetical protein [Vibrio crassostreae]|uniref:hypothetical protein n=1 Tax=Vibrio crassostreae TaxID=246167 RepID=UPI001B31656F|nr:hypothetical protein [Vibrio crassostreae]
MHRVLNQLNVSITTNRDCNLRCNHCYITKQEKANNADRMSLEIFKRTFDQVDKLLTVDSSLTEVEWELIGGEPTQMPFEFWEEALPYALEQSAQINKKFKTVGDVNFITNMIIRDDRYFNLFNECAKKYDNFYLYVSWEPDTGRFGNKNKLEPKFLSNLKKLNVKNLTLGTVFTNGLIDLGAKGFIDKFKDIPLSDLSVEMLSPFGDGKSFWHRNKVTFKQMSQFFIDLEKLSPSFVYSPKEEMMKSLTSGTPIHCDGNYKYDLCIEPNGETHFNSSRTGDEKVDGKGVIGIGDPLWAYKVSCENSGELLNKVTFEHPQCHQCKRLPYCNAGWYHYKNEKLAQDLIVMFEGDCAGMSDVWNEIELQQPALSSAEEAKSAHLQSLKNLIKVNKNTLAESDIKGLPYQDYLSAISEHRGFIVIDENVLWGKGLWERVVFYDSIGLTIKIDNKSKLLNETISENIKHIVYGNFQISEVESTCVWDLIFGLPSGVEKNLYLESLNACLPYIGINDSFVKGTTGRIAVDSRNLHLFRWIISNPPSFSEIENELGTINRKNNNDFLKLIRSNIEVEALIGGVNEV